MADTCPHCEHALRDHRVQTPVYDNRAEFVCRCGCRVNGSVEQLNEKVN